jgi:hypothetical protein
MRSANDVAGNEGSEMVRLAYQQKCRSTLMRGCGLQKSGITVSIRRKQRRLCGKTF